MKLYLSSYHLGDEPRELQSLVGNNKRVAVICNAIDSLPESERAAQVEGEIYGMMGLGFKPVEIDLRYYFDQLDGLEKALSDFGLLWIRGGNSFVLRKAFALSGFDRILKPLLNSGMVYAGYSAAAVVAGPTLHGIELVDNMAEQPDGYAEGVLWTGLKLIDYTILPHYRSEHPESGKIEKVVQFYKENKLKFVTLQDGDAIVVDNDELPK